MRERLKSPRIASGWGIENKFFTELGLGWYASAVAFAYAIVLIRQILKNNFAIGIDGKDCTDFTWIWLSSKFAVSGTLAQAYDYSVFTSARAALIGPANCILEHFDYPPTLLLFAYPLGLMPYSTAFAAWMAATLLLYLAAVHTIIPRPVAIISAVTISPVFLNVLLGHNGFLTAGLIGFALALMERRPWLSGIFLGLLTYKPQFGILFPFALLASRHWRALFSAAAASVVFGVTATIAFGYQAWPSFIDALADRASSLSENPELNLPLVSVFGFLRLVGVAAHAAWTVQLAFTAVVAAMISVLWARAIPHSLKAAALAVGTLLAAPHAIGYDVCILTIAVAFLVEDGLSRGFLRGERAVMLMCWAGLIRLAGPIPAIICVVLLVLILRRTVGCQGDAVAAPPLVLEMLVPRT